MGTGGKPLDKRACPFVHKTYVMPIQSALSARNYVHIIIIFIIFIFLSDGCRTIEFRDKTQNMALSNHVIKSDQVLDEGTCKINILLPGTRLWVVQLRAIERWEISVRTAWQKSFAVNTSRAVGKRRVYIQWNTYGRQSILFSIKTKLAK